MRRRSRGHHVPIITGVNGWEIEKTPNTFAESFVYEAFALDNNRMVVSRAGFQSLRAAIEWCWSNQPPTDRHKLEPDAV